MTPSSAVDASRTMRTIHRCTSCSNARNSASNAARSPCTNRSNRAWSGSFDIYNAAYRAKPGKVPSRLLAISRATRGFSGFEVCEDPARAAERHQREVVAVEVVVDHEAALQLGALRDALARLLVAKVHARAEPVAGEAGAGVVRLVPSAVVALRIDEEAEPAPNRALVLAIVRRDERDQGPGRLRRRAGAVPAQAVIHVRRTSLAPAAVRVLVGDEPLARRAYVRLSHVLADRRERREHGGSAVNVIDAPATEPRAVRFLLRADEFEPARYGGMIAREPEQPQRLEHVRRHIGGWRVERFAEVAERNLRDDPVVVIPVERGPAAVRGLHRERPGKCAVDHRTDPRLVQQPARQAREHDE